MIELTPATNKKRAARHRIGCVSFLALAVVALLAAWATLPSDFRTRAFYCDPGMGVRPCSYSSTDLGGLGVLLGLLLASLAGAWWCWRGSRLAGWIGIAALLGLTVFVALVMYSLSGMHS